jgi:two-component system, chemotaxis family, response regulator Rcp1
MRASGPAIEILLVEDNPGDIRLTQEAMKDARVANNLHVVRNGEDAMDFLLQRGPFATAPRPDIILLDLNLPRKDGREVLEEIKQHQTLLAIPVVILTTSEAEEDVLCAYNLHANCYITKPLDFRKFSDVVRMIEGFWFTIVKLPPA